MWEAQCIRCFLTAALCVGCSGLSLTTPTSRIFGRVGGDVTFDVSPNPSNVVLQTVTWTLNNTNMVVSSAGSTVGYGQGYEGRAHLNTMTGSLSLFRLTLRDSGQYNVSIGTTEGGSTSGSVTLQVLDPVSVPTIQSNVTNPVEFNDTVTLTCTASGSDVSYRWFNGSSEVSDTQRIHLSADKRTLTISGVLRSDDGPFYCYVYNHVSNGTSKPFNLNVKYGPDLPILSVSPNKSVYAAGSSLILQCSAQSNPTAQYQWFLNGTSLNKRSQELKIRNIQVDQAGNYTCWAFNDVTLRYAAVHRVIDVREPVSDVTIQPPPEKPTEKKNFSLTCKAEHAHSFLWLKDGNSLDTNGTISLLNNNQTLSFLPLLQSYSGTYTCMASNIVSNKTSKEYTLVMNISTGQQLLTTEQIAAIAVCSALLVLAVTALVIFLLMRHRRSNAGSSKSSSPTAKPEDALVYTTPTFLKEPGDRKTTQNADPNTQYANISKQPQVQSNTVTEYAELRRK
ncbi:carcinoembryonic antigen-related cell adhesion molecule 1-like isoform X1 [Polypterus senegalus]|uniref:carcinoembryonic antigen-related cell adhesion molecule 1-like isoform X1 n=1 Tax=Polypterus senegalus TaxID=55291 RepID=UPI0019661715|nr:carcinoembryonic antigen-related cell adhesion molecule 1-like isoform X1 [Polypterus senegalus]